MTLVASLLFAPLYSGLAARIRLSSFLPWVYGFVALTIGAFYALFAGVNDQNRWVIAAFFVWVSTFNVLDHLGVLDLHGGHLFSYAGEAFVRLRRGRRHHRQHRRAGDCYPAGQAARQRYNLMLISAAGFVVTALLVRMLAREKQRLLRAGVEVQPTTPRSSSGGQSCSMVSCC